jgi:hypothetical protein
MSILGASRPKPDPLSPELRAEVEARVAAGQFTQCATNTFTEDVKVNYTRANVAENSARLHERFPDNVPLIYRRGLRAETVVRLIGQRIGD